jgi:uncharacterized protein (UPF0333 family)
MDAVIEKTHKNQKGQTFIEFIFLLVVLMTISLTFFKSFNYGIGLRWEAYLKVIAIPNQDEVNF